MTMLFADATQVKQHNDAFRARSVALFRGVLVSKLALSYAVLGEVVRVKAGLVAWHLIQSDSACDTERLPSQAVMLRPCRKNVREPREAFGSKPGRYALSCRFLLFLLVHERRFYPADDLDFPQAIIHGSGRLGAPTNIPGTHAKMTDAAAAMLLAKM